jgi:hypothetical protein
VDVVSCLAGGRFPQQQFAIETGREQIGCLARLQRRPCKMIVKGNVVPDPASPHR